MHRHHSDRIGAIGDAAAPAPRRCRRLRTPLPVTTRQPQDERVAATGLYDACVVTMTGPAHGGRRLGSLLCESHEPARSRRGAATVASGRAAPAGRGVTNPV